MRIITGTARGTRLVTLDGEATRPTSEKVKEAVFSSIQFDIEGRTVLDLFGGCGQMALEALSRGAESATIVDNSRDAFEIIKQNAQKTKLWQKCNLLCQDFAQYLQKSKDKEHFNIVFLDPPYAQKLLPTVLDRIFDANIIDENSIIICESESDDIFENKFSLDEKFEITKQAKYGRVYISYLKIKGEN